MKNAKKMTAMTLAVLLGVSILPTSAFAGQENTPKEEVVYINLNGDGSVKEINVVNIFDLDEDGKIIDYGQYEELRNMTTTDTIEYENDVVTIDASAGKLYYEGKLGETVMPWNISIRYYLDGQEYPASDLAGKNGRLEIKMEIRQNPDCDSSFFEGYALQTTFTLDTDHAKNILADGATVANVGREKQITYTILPNNEKDIAISADVDDFEMKAVSINGIRMNLEIEIDDDSLQGKIDDVINAVNDLDDGTGELNDGATELYDATGELRTATSDLYKGTGSLYEGATELKKGLSTLTTKNSDLTEGAWSAFEALCSAAQTQLNEQLSANGQEGVTLTPRTYSSVLLGVLKTMDADKVYKEAYNAARKEVTAQVKEQEETLYAGYIQSQADAIYLEYVKSISDTLYEQAASAVVMQQLIASGQFSEEQAAAYLQTEEGKALVAGTVSNLTEEQKSQIIAKAVRSLTDEQKEQILQGAIASLTKEQKEEIVNGYVEQMMVSKEVTSQIDQAVQTVNAAAAEVSALKGQLDNYNYFYKGLVEYTGAVSTAASGATELKNGLSTLYSNTDTLKTAAGDLHDAVGTLKDGTGELKDGTGEFVGETANMDMEVRDEIDSMTASMTGEDVETVSFVSEQNTNIKSVQFVIQTESIEMDEADNAEDEEAETLSFWQKLLKLFGLY